MNSIYFWLYMLDIKESFDVISIIVVIANIFFIIMIPVIIELCSDSLSKLIKYILIFDCFIAISFFIMPSKETIKHVLINETTVELEKNPNNVNLKYILDDIKKRK